ncbi:MAG: 50S ribosomal protein L10 [Clostridia bacterium]
MSNAKNLKAKEIADIKTKLENSKALVLVDYKGLTVEQDTKLRAEFRKAKIEYKVFKNTLVRHAFNEMGVTEFNEALNGPTAIAFGFEDEATTCKAVYAQTKELKEKFNIKCGRVEGEFQNEKEIEILAQLPSRNELIAQLMATMMAPVQYVVYALNAIVEKQEKENA